MDNLTTDERNNRADYIDNWYKTEKSLFRVAGVVLFFIAGLVAVYDKPGDQWTLLVITGSVAGGLTLLIRNRRPRSARIGLHFLKAKTQMSRATVAGMGSVLLLSMMGSRPLALIVGLMLGVVAVWYQWRAYKIRMIDELATAKQAESPGENDA